MVLKSYIINLLINNTIVILYIQKYELLEKSK